MILAASQANRPNEASNYDTNQSSLQDDYAVQPPPQKMARMSLFASYQKRREEKKPLGASCTALSAVTVATTFVEKMVSIASQTSGDDAWEQARSAENYSLMYPLLQKVFTVPATSAPVERVFSYGGIIARPHRARLGDDLLSKLVYLKCNEHV